MEQYLGVGCAVILFIVSVGIFTTPKQLSETKDKIEEDVDKKLEKFASKEAVTALTNEITDMKKKIDKIYDFILGNKE